MADKNGVKGTVHVASRGVETKEILSCEHPWNHVLIVMFLRDVDFVWLTTDNRLES